MASRVIYLEVDDEITSAAARIRTTEASRVAVVLPYSSRVATSRINFRLLSRDALTHEKRLSIVSGDPATRALAASAGLPVFSSVAEYETSVAGLDDETAAADAKAAVEVVASEPVATPKARASKASKAAKAAKAAAAAAAVTVSDAPTAADQVAPAAGVAATTLWGDEAPPVETARTPVRRDPAPTHDRKVVDPTPQPGGRSRSRAPVAIGLAILALALVVAGVGTYLLLPSATIAVTPRLERVLPIGITVVADPTATAPDAVAGVVPADEIAVPVSVSQNFPSSGKRVEETKATGTVRFANLDPTASNTIAAGSIVRTSDGIRFRTDAAVTVPKSELIGVVIYPARASVKVTAVDGGTDGNVEADRITRVPNNENSIFLKVTNPEPTSGGTHVEFPRVLQEDVDAAMGILNTMLDAVFADQVKDPALATGGATVIPETATLGERTPSVDPATLVSQEVPTFDLGLSATGTVIAVDAAPVATIAETKLRAAVKADHELVAGSIEIQVGPAIVNGRAVRFEATASAEQIAILDADALKRLVLGKPIGEARTILAPYGTVELTVWPDWVGSIPTFDSRVQLTVPLAVQIETPAPSGSGSAP